MPFLSREVLYYGTPEPPEGRPVQAGPLSATFENGALLNIRWHGREVLRRIYVAVRDQNWGTPLAKISNLQMLSDTESFHLAFEALHCEGEINFAWKGKIEGNSRGQLRFLMDGEARSTFARSRIGFCLLHAAEDCAGKTFEVGQPDGQIVQGCFPEKISRQQPIAATEAMSELAYEAAPGLQLTIRFLGDVFQMEDQRNWTDATFKTFCTPLELPCPIRIDAGTRIRQEIEFSIAGSLPVPAVLRPDEPVIITIDHESAAPLPKIGLGLANHGELLTGQAVSRLRAMGIAHLRADLRLWQPDWQATLRWAAAEALLLDCGLEAAVFVSDFADLEFHAMREFIERERPNIVRWLIFHRSQESTAEAICLLAKVHLESWNSDASFGSGTNAYFQQLGSFSTSCRQIDCVCFSIHPQEHLFDHASLIETLAVQGTAVENARDTYQLPVAVGPVTLRPRFNANAPEAEEAVPAGQLPGPVDPRQMSLFGAVWTLGSLKYLSESNAASVTYYETTGWRGVMEEESGSLLPDRFRSLPGAVFPLYHVLAGIGEFAGGEVLPSKSSEPLKVISMSMRLGSRHRLMIGNSTSQRTIVSVSSLPLHVETTILDEESVMEALLRPELFRGSGFSRQETLEGKLILRLGGYSIVQVDW